MQQYIGDLCAATVRSIYYAGTTAAGPRHDVVQTVAIEALVHLFRYSTSNTVRGLVLKHILQLRAELPGMAEKIGQYLDQLLDPNPKILTSLSPLNKLQPLVLEPEHLECAALLVNAGCSMTPAGHKPWVLLINTTYPAASDKLKPLMNLVIVQAFLQQVTEDPAFTQMSTLTGKFGNKLSRYQIQGKYYDEEILAWLQQVREGLSVKTSETLVLPLWTKVLEKPAEQTYQTYIESQYNIMRVGQDGLATDACTPEQVEAAASMASKMRELNVQRPPQGGSTYIKTQASAVSVEGGGVAHIFNPDFFVNAAKGLSSLIGNLAAQAEPSATTSSSSTASGVVTPPLPRGANPAAFFKPPVDTSTGGTLASSSSNTSTQTSTTSTTAEDLAGLDKLGKR